ncbi:hypothetical protein BRC90_11555 [Halobacteriales archaeon QS_4_69_34]|nr:MAG: hypothetical protein BRC90_11555 [Halobacteriales archaeon QS_4_69_34]
MVCPGTVRYRRCRPRTERTPEPATDETIPPAERCRGTGALASTALVGGMAGGAGVATAQRATTRRRTGRPSRNTREEFEELLIGTNHENGEGETENPVTYDEVFQPVDGERLADVSLITDSPQRGGDRPTGLSRPTSLPCVGGP